MKTGKAQIAAYYVNCPNCNEPFDGTYDGSQDVSMHNFAPSQIGTLFSCSCCSEQYRLPQALRKVFP